MEGKEDSGEGLVWSSLLARPTLLISPPRGHSWEGALSQEAGPGRCTADPAQWHIAGEQLVEEEAQEESWLREEKQLSEKKSVSNQEWHLALAKEVAIDRRSQLVWLT